MIKRIYGSNHSIKKPLIWVLITVLSIGNIIPILAQPDEADTEWDAIELVNDLNPAASPSNGSKASSSDAEKASDANAGQNVLLPELMVRPQSQSTGDLWSDWLGDISFSGLGTAREPYQISTFAQLMGVSELVAAGTTFEDVYFELTRDIDLANIQTNNGNWNPIGWYQNASELSGTVSHPFKGHFDGAGNTIYGLSVNHSEHNVSNVGLFGSLAGGSVRNLIIEADDIYGVDNVGVLAGSITGDTVIYNVMVNGYVHAESDAGGIAGEVSGGTNRVTIENCTADGIVIYGSKNSGYVGGIAGNVQKADLVDSAVYTHDGDGNRIQGKGYVGGIVGRMNQVNIFNSYVSGTIGGNNSIAVGGIAGKYESGNLIVARFDGDISRTNNGTAAREGTFVGTRESRHNFTYGIGSSNNISYLFTTNAAKAKTVFGSNIDGDNSFTKTAHIGYWTTGEKKYTLVAGKNEIGSGDHYFYEELEAGIKHIITNKLDKEFTSSGYYKGLKFRMDHFAPGYQGEPVRGYLVSVPRIDALNANGTYDTDVAALTALPVGNNSFYRQIDKDNPSAVAYGVTVSVSTAAKNSYGNRYQMVYDNAEAGGVKPPTYVAEDGTVSPMTYTAGGTYSFIMPQCDTELYAEYIKVTTELTMTPAESVIHVIQTRSGNRKSPSVMTEVKDSKGILIARYIDGVADSSVEVQPISIHAEHNNAGNTADKTVQWSVDDTDLLIHSSPSGYTLTDAKVMPNIQSRFIQAIINQEVQAQADAGYHNPIADTVYTRHAVVTAATNPATTADHQTVYGNTKVTVAFQIIDDTTIRVEGLVLNKSNIVCTITRTLTGDRLNPTEKITCTTPVMLTATLSPNRPYYKHIKWNDNESGKIISLTASGDYTQDCTLGVRYDADGNSNPVWIQNVINTDNALKENDPYAKISGSATYTELITASSEDQTNGHVSAECDVTIHFVTVDETEIHPENILLDKNELIFYLIQTKTGRKSSPVITWTGAEPQQLRAVVYPNLDNSSQYKPYNRQVTWQSGHEALRVTDGRVLPDLNSDWIKQTISRSPYAGTIEIPIVVTTVDDGKQASCTVTLDVKVIDQTTGSSGGSGGGGGSSSVSGAKSAGTVGMAAGPVNSVIGTWTKVTENNVDHWLFSTSERTYVNEWAYILNPYAAEGQPNVSWFRFGPAGYMVTGWYTDMDGHVYYLNPRSDNTQGIMATGWKWIAGKCYYFSETTTATYPRGGMQKNTITPDGKRVNEAGQWTVNGTVQMLENE